MSRADVEPGIALVMKAFQLVSAMAVLQGVLA
jgi:hypothetical protein